MPTWLWVVIAVVAVAVVVAAVFGAQARRRSRLRSTFGPEYDRALQAGGNRREAEAELAGRVKRRQSLEIRPLEPGVRDQYIASWQGLQARFVDDPADAVRNADVLVNEVMGRRGYPMADFEQRAADVSVDHADVVDNYRRAHRVADAMSGGGQVTTEDLREAMLHYRSLFARLLEAPQPSAEPVR